MLLRYTSFVLILWMAAIFPIFSQSTICNPTTTVDTSSYEGTAYFNFGSVTKSRSQKYQTALSIGQNFVGYTENNTNSTYLGFYGRYLLPPFALKVNATEGDLLDRIQLNWTVDGLGPSPNEGFNIYRDGIFLATVGSNIRSYNDFNVIAGVAYKYSVRGINAYGEGSPSYALGFQVPNGVVTGWVQTTSGNPVPDAIVTLMPMQGFSAKFDPTDGALAIPDVNNPLFPVAGMDWTMTFWIKTDLAATNASLIHLSPAPFYVKAISSASEHEGIEVSSSVNGSPLLSATFDDGTKNGWHHVAVSFEGSGDIGRLYIDGVLKAQMPINEVTTVDSLKLGSQAGLGGWTGRIDELRIYHSLLNELDYGEVMEGTASSQTPFLSHYWKMDEEQGLKSYDLKNRVKLYFCGAVFDGDIPPVRTAGKTNIDGYYRIESASYGTGTTFLAEPAKAFYLHKSVNIKSSNGAYINMPDFALTPKSSIEMWVNSASAIGTQSLLSKKWGNNEFKLFVEASGLENVIKVFMNGNTHSFGNLGTGFQHLAFTIDSLSGMVNGYRNGELAGSHTFSGVTGNWSDTTHLWVVGASTNGNVRTDFFNGLIDEVAVYDTTLSPQKIINHFQQSRDIQERGLRVYFPMDEGNGFRISNVGSVLVDNGNIVNGTWSSFAPNQVTDPHKFTPKTRQVTLNPSVTSVDQVDFIDRSTVPVSGYVRYKNTDCFAKNVEILVDNVRFNPPVFTDSTGKFVIDFDPGTSAVLTPVLENHVFVPASWPVSNVVNPIAGIVFNDITTHKVKGIVAGGSKPECKKSIIRHPAGDAQNQGTVCIVEVRSVDGCFVRTITIDNVEGEYEFQQLPPIEQMTVAVIEHSDDNIKTSFSVQGGSTVNLVTQDTIINFIYVAPPVPEITSGLDTVAGCSPGVIVLDKGDNITINIRLKEVYVGGDCYLDTANFNIINGFSDLTLDTTMRNGNLQYKFKVGAPNPSPPYLKTLQIIGTSEAGRKGSLLKQAVITGIKEKRPTFTTKLPERPVLVLHDPPGDGSFAYLEKDSSVCYTTGISLAVDKSFGGGTTFNLIPKVVIETGFIISKQTEIRPILGGTIKLGTTISRMSDSTFQTCLKTNQRISTDDGDLIVGGERGGDVFMGVAQNIIFGNVDQVTFDNCTVSVIESVALTPGDFATTFIYSEFNIRNYVLPNLAKMLNNPNITAADSITQSIQRWNKILNDNDDRKSKARAIRNISFDAGASYEYSASVDTVRSNTIARDTSIKFESSLLGGIYFDDLGGTIGVDVSVSSSYGKSSGSEVQFGNTIGYTLKDDDPGDFFSVDIGIDSAYLTPTFKLKAGQSSCPWEPGSANREGPNLQLGIGTLYTAPNVPSNEPAVFKMLLGNQSATNEDWTYGFTAIAGSNPDGAIIKLNGQPLNNNTIQYIVPHSTSVPITLTVERGPIAYEYNNLKVALVSECEMARNFALSLPLDNDPKFFSSINLGVDFIRPCSEVKVNVPEQNWVVINNDPIQGGTKRRITVSGYDLSSTDFQRIRVQYRLSDGNGAWINILDTSVRYNPYWSGFSTLPDPKPPVLQPDFTQFIWETAGLSDGNYEIHAWAECSGDASDKPGFSQIIKGRIDRQPPSLVGSPQPSDGVYHVGDEISFTFNKHVNCKKLNPLDDVLLIDAVTGDTMDIKFTCFENKIVLDPSFQNKFYENKVLRAELHNIEDLVGNNSSYFKWEFYVDRNELAWLKDSIGMTKFVDESKTISAKIHNRGGYPVPFKIESVPDWVHVTPDRGTLVANEVMDIHFSVDSLVPLGTWSDSIILHTEEGLNPFFMGGDEVLKLGARVICRPPVWVLNPSGFDPSDYSFSMNFSLQLDIEGVLSTDGEDIVGAYVNGKLRGVAKLQYKPSLNKYVAFLTVYSNEPSGETITFQIWDASACHLYAGTIETFPFVADDIIGLPLTPQTLHTAGKILRRIYIHTGWNWISMNLELPDASVGGALISLNNPAGALIKGQTEFSAYSLILQQWIGSLNSISPYSLYQLNAIATDSILMVGVPIDVTQPIPVNAGWNWIGYLPQSALPINAALASLNPQENDIIKSQVSFAQYVTGLGWVGNLNFLSAPNGYLLKLTNAGILTYPDPQNFNGESETASRSEQYFTGNTKTLIDAIRQEAMPFSYWQVDPSRFEFSMNAIAIVLREPCDNNMLSIGDEVGVFAGNEVRGSSKALFIPQLNAYMVFLTIYGNTEGELLKFKFFDASENQEVELMDKTAFRINSIWGTVDMPQPLSLSLPSSTDDIGVNTDHFVVYPNPFTSNFTLKINGSKEEQLRIEYKDVHGKVLDYKSVRLKSGLNLIDWTVKANIPGGVYFISVGGPNEKFIHKVLYLK